MKLPRRTFLHLAARVEPPPARDASPSALEVASSQSRRYDDELARRPLPAWEPPELIVGEPLTVWTEVRGRDRKRSSA